MKQEIRKRKNELLKQSINLRNYALDFDGKKSIEIREKQDEVYNRWKFYSNMIKEMEKHNG